jgi:hypothetical protein
MTAVTWEIKARQTPQKNAQAAGFTGPVPSEHHLARNEPGGTGDSGNWARPARREYPRHGSLFGNT